MGCMPNVHVIRVCVYVYIFTRKYSVTFGFHGMITDSIGMPCKRYFIPDTGTSII